MIGAVMAILKRIPGPVKIGLVIAIAVTALLARGRAWHNSEVTAAAQTAATKTRDSVSKATSATFDSATRASAFELGALREVYAAQQRATLHLQRTVAGKAATDSLYAAKARLSAAAKADTTVVIYVAASDSVAAENGQLKSQATELITAVAETEQRARAVHAADTATIRGLSGEVVAARDSLAVEVAKPKRSLKSDVVTAAVGGGVVVVVKAALKLIKGN